MTANIGLPEALLAGATIIAAIVSAVGAVAAALIARSNARKLQTPGEGTLGEKVQKIIERTEEP